MCSKGGGKQGSREKLEDAIFRVTNMKPGELVLQFSDDPEKVDDEPMPWHCRICEYVLEDPVVIVPCGHLACKKCLQDWKVEKEPTALSLAQCPFCTQRIASIAQSKDLKTIIEKLTGME
jgi:hypothetical protein